MGDFNSVKVSVCMATYNGSAYIAEQLKSILSQLRLHDEVVISDDSSTDDTLLVIKSFNDARIKVLPNQTFKNPIYNFENALNKASGEIIFLADQDDIWAPDKVKKIVAALIDYDLAVCDCSIINDREEVLSTSYFNIVNSGTGVIKNLKKNTYLGCCMAFNRRILKKALPFPADIPMHDIWLGFIADLFYKPVFIKDQLTFYRKHANNASITSDIVSNYKLSKKLNFRINTIKYIPMLLLR